MVYTCRVCDGDAKQVVEKCPHCGYRGEDDRTDAKQTAKGILAFSGLIITAPITIPLGIAFYILAYTKPTEGEAPFEGMTRDEWREMKS